MRFVVLVLLAGCAASSPPPVAGPPPASPPPVQEVSIAKSPVLRFEKTPWLVYSATDHGLAPRATVSYADVACRTDSGHTTCAMRGHDDKRAEHDLEYQARLEQCFHVTQAKLPPPTLRALEASPATPPKSAATFTSVAIDARSIQTIVTPVIDCPGPPCPATTSVQGLVDDHGFKAYFGSSNEVVDIAFATRWVPLVFAIVEGDYRFTQRVSDPHDVLLSMEGMDLEREGDEVRLANLVDRAVLAFQVRDQKKAVAYTKELDAWLATHHAVDDANFQAARATLAELSKGSLRTTDPCTSP